jgi:BA14K-like protein
MRKAISATLAWLVLATSSVATTASAEPYRFERQDRYVQNYCNDHWRDPDCRDWREHRHSWNDDRYHRWYDDHRNEFGPQDAAAAIFGFVAGAAAGAISGGMNGATTGSHRAACDARYRSYDWRTDTFMGYDGQRHYCRL